MSKQSLDHELTRVSLIKTKFYIEEDDEYEKATGKTVLKYWKLDAVGVAFECALRLGYEENAYEFGNRLLKLYE